MLLEYGLTLFDSCQIARHLRFDYPRKDVSIIAVTGQTDDERRMRYTDAGIDVLLTDLLDPDVFETFLTLQRGRLNRSATDAAVTLAGEEFVPVRPRDNVN